MTEGHLRTILSVAALIFVGIATLAFLLLGRGVIAPEQSAPMPNYTFLLFVGQDRWVAVAYTCLFVTAAILPWAGFKFDWLGQRRVLWGVVLATLLIALVSRFWVSHNFDLSLDEYLPRFQAEIFQSGRLMAPLSPEDFEHNVIFQPFFTYIDENHRLWASAYRPVHAMILAIFGLVGAADMLNPVMAVLAVLAIASIARRLFPTRSDAPILAVLLLIASPQFLITAGTGFSFGAHLAFNLIWLAAFLSGGWRGHCAAAFIGFWAVGLHQVHVHPLFAAPFLLALQFGGYGHKRYVFPYILSYGLALPLWMMWPELAVWLQTGDTSGLPRSILEIEYIQNYLRFARAIGVIDLQMPLGMLLLNLMRFLTWLSPALIVLVLVGLSLRRRLGLTPILLLASFALTVLVTHALMPMQEQSWGSRYYHPVLGNLVLFGLAGYDALEPRLDLAQSRKFVMSMILVSLLVLVPWRAFQVSEKIGPRAAVQIAIAAIEADVVAINPRGILYPYDFIRNHPDLQNRPLIITAYKEGDYAFPPGNVVVLDADGLQSLGLPIGTMYEPVITY